MPTSPTPPIELLGNASRLTSTTVEVPQEAIAALASICETIEFDGTGDDPDPVAEASRDWWPLALHWALAGQVPQLAEVVVRPTSTDEVVRVVQVCNHARLPLTVTGGRSGVCGAAAPVFGGVVLDATALRGVVDVDAVSGIVEVLPGTFGPDLEDELRPTHGLSVGHFPQSFDLATVGGWVASRGAGQYSTRYGKIEDMVVGLEAVLADGTVIRTGGAPAAAAGPDLTQLLVGSEGTLARDHPGVAADPPGTDARAARRLRVRDVRRRHRGVPADSAGAAPRRRCCASTTPSSPSAARAATAPSACCWCSTRATPISSTRRCRSSSTRRSPPARDPMSTSLVDAWMGHRNDTSALQGLTRKGFVVDTMEIAAPWSRLDRAVRRRTRRDDGGAARAGGHVPPLPQLSRRRVPLLHLRRDTASRARSSRPMWRSGTPASGRCWRAAATCRTTTASG